MARYDYTEAVMNDIRTYLEDEYQNKYTEYDREELETELHDDLWINDSVTGNASGSYTFCRQEAKEYVVENMSLLMDACEAFCVEAKEIGKRFLAEDWEYFDVTIRCYCLSEAITNVLDEMGVE